MALLFDRKVKLVVYTSSGQKYEVSDLHMSFDILLRRDSKPNTAKINVYNMSESTRNLLESDPLGAEFYAGYGDSIPDMIFRGTVSNIVNEKIRPDWMTTIYASDGHKEFDKTYFNKTYSAGTPLLTILKDISIVFQMPLNIDPAIANVVSQALTRSITLSGKAKKALDRLTGDYDLDWSVQFGIVEIIEKGSAITSDPLVTVLTHDTGLIGSPQVKWEKNKKNRKSKPKYVKTVKATSLLIPSLKPNRLMQIASVNTSLIFGDLYKERVPSKNANGLYLINTAQFIGDNFGGSFDTVTQGISS